MMSDETRNLIELVAAGVAGAVGNVLREVYETGTDAEIEVARRCWYAALETAGVVPPLCTSAFCSASRGSHPRQPGCPGGG
jgi:hypothetical protein